MNPNTNTPNTTSIPELNIVGGPALPEAGNPQAFNDAEKIASAGLSTAVNEINNEIPITTMPTPEGEAVTVIDTLEGPAVVSPETGELETPVPSATAPGTTTPTTTTTIPRTFTVPTTTVTTTTVKPSTVRYKD